MLKGPIFGRYIQLNITHLTAMKNRKCFCTSFECRGTEVTANKFNRHRRQDKKDDKSRAHKRKASAFEDICNNYDSDIEMKCDGSEDNDFIHHGSQPDVPAPSDDSSDDNPSDSGGDSVPDAEGSDDSTDGGHSFASCHNPSLNSVFSAEQEATINYNKSLFSIRGRDWSAADVMTTLQAITIILLLSDESSLGYNTTATIFMVRDVIYWCVA